MNKETPMSLTRDCRCPMCGFKTMATRCRKCGQLLVDDVPITSEDGILLDVHDRDGMLVMTGSMDMISDFTGMRKRDLYFYLRSGCRVKRKWRIRNHEEG